MGFSAYAWLLKATTPARLSTYAYVNPVIALFLGWAFGGEMFTGQILAAAGVIVLGVVIITARRTPPAELVGNRASVRTASSATSTPRNGWVQPPKELSGIV